MNTIRPLLTAVLVAAGSFAPATSARAQATGHASRAATTHVSGDAKLKAEAKVKEADAIAIATKEVPNGTILSGEIEREGGKLIYSFDIKVPGKSGIEEVNVDAMTGALVAHEHETPKAEKKEAAADAKEQQATAGYHITQRIPLGGEGGWDYIAVDTARARLFIARSDRIMVVDQASGKVLGEIAGLNRGHGVAFDYATNHGFATSGADSTVTMFDLGTLAVLKRTIAAVDDDAVLYDPVSKRVFTMNGDANSVSVIDPATGNHVGNVPLGGKPEFGVTDRAGKLFVNLADKGEVVELDPVALTVTRRWSIAPCEDPSGLAIDAVHHRLFSVCGNKKMAVSDVASGKLVTTLSIGEGVDAAAFDAATADVFASNGEGTMTVVHEDAPDKYHVVATVQTMPGARTMALDPKTHRLYTISARMGPMPATAPAGGRRRAPMIPGSFTLLVLER